MTTKAISTSVLFFASLTHIVSNATTVGGIISVDTVWSNTSEAYTFSSAVQIRNGVTLTIAPGVKIQNGDIKVFGNLNVQGTSADLVSFKNVNVIPAGNGDPAKKFSIDINGASFLGGSLYAPTGNAIYGSLALQRSTLTNIPYMYIWYPTSDVTIKQNIFKNSGGISTGTSSVNVLVENNLFDGSNGFAVENWASYGTASTTVRLNSFLNSSGTVVKLPSGYNSVKLDARNNYWGTTSEAAIQGMIFDENDDLSSGGVIPYSPFLLAADVNTPSITAVPEPETYALYILGLCVVFGSIRGGSRLGRRALAI